MDDAALKELNLAAGICDRILFVIIVIVICFVLAATFVFVTVLLRIINCHLFLHLRCPRLLEELLGACTGQPLQPPGCGTPRAAGQSHACSG